jgi:hypothetical protein
MIPRQRGRSAAIASISHESPAGLRGLNVESVPKLPARTREGSVRNAG